MVTSHRSSTTTPHRAHFPPPESTTPSIKQFKWNLIQIVLVLVSVSFLQLPHQIGTNFDTISTENNKWNDFEEFGPTIARYEYLVGGPSNVSIRDHPHAGARDENGYWNYVPDVTFVRRKALSQLNDGDTIHYLPITPELVELVCQVAPGTGDEGADGYKLLRYVQLNGTTPVPEHFIINVTDIPTNVSDTLNSTSSPTTDASNMSPPRILCAVYTHDARRDQIQVITETWGWRCDGFFAASTKTLKDIGAIDLPHRGEESYENMWQKTRSILAFMFDNYIDEYDYFYLLGDDAYVIVENLRNYLHLLESWEGGRDTRPLFLGQLVPWGYFGKWGDIIGNGGGSGYILNRLALQRFVIEALPACWAEEKSSAEDVYVSKCLLDLGIPPVDTADAAHRQRFHGDSVNEVATSGPSSSNYFVLAIFDLWAKDHGYRYGMDVPSTQSVAFHKAISPISMMRHHAIVYNSCPVGTVLRDAIENEKDTI